MAIELPYSYSANTRSGAVYRLGYRKDDKGRRSLLAKKDNWPSWETVVAVYPDRLPFLEATTSWKREPDGRLAGYNEKGTRTVLLDPLALRAGMVLFSPKGIRSTRIVSFS